MQSPTALIKRAPRWSLYVGGGVILGGFALRMYRNRTTADGTSAATATTPDAQTVGSGPAYGVSSASPGVIVPPVIVNSGTADQSGTGLGQLQDTYFGGLHTLLDTFGGITGGLFGQNAQLVDAQTGLLNTSVGTLSTIALNAGAGSAPQPVASNPTPVVAFVPVPVSAPVATPAPAAPVAAPSQPRCSGKYPFLNEANGQCYAVACATGAGGRRKGRWHVYPNSANDQWMGPTC